MDIMILERGAPAIINGGGTRDRLAQFLRTFVAADFYNARSDVDFDGTLVEPAIAGRTGFFSHELISVVARRSGQA
jgi:hypothetical protein